MHCDTSHDELIRLFRPVFLPLSSSNVVPSYQSLSLGDEPPRPLSDVDDFPLSSRVLKGSAVVTANSWGIQRHTANSWPAICCCSTRTRLSYSAIQSHAFFHTASLWPLQQEKECISEACVPPVPGTSPPPTCRQALAHYSSFFLPNIFSSCT